MESLDVHGRILTTNPEAAAWYRRAQESSDRRATVRALQSALQWDPGFAVAAADLGYLASAPSPPAGAPPQAWERHHIEIVRTVQAGNTARARALLIEHLATVGCDPLATAIAAPEVLPAAVTPGDLPHEPPAAALVNGSA